ncbi:hypothetical protein PHMEG_00020491 [Phytophthora megakarya]|uniref:Uncharacterized protein n=1 Tax=Phytophthora megakarya TaxID=4795 RepID=A0A225VNS3_9STRA|nr:hypothetical protein PHMEG_00020491 [Phytophthora megakarya]
MELSCQTCQTCSATIHLRDPATYYPMSNNTCACCKHLVSWMAFEDHTKNGAARRCKACVNGSNWCRFWHREAPPPPAPKPTAEDERQERLETMRATMGHPPQ